MYWFNGGSTLGILHRQKFYTFLYKDNKLSPAWSPIDVSAVRDIDWSKLDDLIAFSGDTVFAGVNGTASETGHSSLTAYDMKTGQALYTKTFTESMQRLYAENGAFLVQTRSVIDKAYDKLYALDPVTGNELYAGTFDAALTDVRADTNTFLLSQADGTLLRIDRGTGTQTVLSLSLQSDKTSVFRTISADGSHAALCDDTNLRTYIFDIQNNCVAAQYWGVEGVTFTPDGKGYIITTQNACGYVPFMDIKQVIAECQKELAENGTVLSPDEKRQYFIE